MTLVAAEGIAVRQGRLRVLQDVTLHIRPGEIVTIVGPNGSGKSTLLRALIGAVPLAAGRVMRRPGLRIGYVPQKLHIDPTLPITVRRFLDLPHPVEDTHACAALEEAGASGLEGRQMAALSGGQFQRVLLARAILPEPDLLILDEPTQGLDQPGASAFYRRLEAIRDRLGCAVLMVSHDLHVVMSASDRVICLNGHICCEGTPAVVSAAPAWRELFGTGTQGALALYRHRHDHTDHAAHHHSPLSEGA
ncbi:ABC-type Mn/Zn transport system, ATPase component [Rubellimicrobium thermophilum DSM 16684]|uniref:ABC-type Mn/Zn transport system, ATPase component n=1 Tax=Rubellimicrobium thermophilum DSM 16684 TaxID=1123069 RepID=S9QW55_9RHOB|nr:metal ABC transporter ATP-binding protein [Rubellimicrobium thermophilum]EPX83822.1 ABC-type Mn/Zn transport system, ATPase component [Rubellimicrobium thermophilum DSM 16684]